MTLYDANRVRRFLYKRMPPYRMMARAGYKDWYVRNDETKMACPLSAIQYLRTCFWSPKFRTLQRCIFSGNFRQAALGLSFGGSHASNGKLAAKAACRFWLLNVGVYPCRNKSLVLKRQCYMPYHLDCIIYCIRFIMKAGVFPNGR